MSAGEALLCIVPPYRRRNCPPAGAAALLGHAKASGLEFAFLDLRLSAPDVLAPTYDPVGVFGESYVIDVPDLPIALSVIAAKDEGRADFLAQLDAKWFQRYCLERGLESRRLRTYLHGVHRLVQDSFVSLKHLKFVGFSVWTSNYATSLLAAATLKRRPRPPFIVAGGPQVTESRAAALLALRAGIFDAVVLGEGETALIELYQALEEGKLDNGIEGVLLRRADGTVIEGGARKLMHLTSLAEPDFTSMSLPDYRGPTGTLRLPFQLSRGCTDKCSFCSEWVFWKHFRISDVSRAVEQIQSLAGKFNVRDFHFTDSLINGHMRRLQQFADQLLSAPVPIRWGGFMRADIDLETARLLRAAGFAYAYVGVESFSDETLRLMNKRRTESENIKSIRAFLDAGIPVAAGVIPGFPGDTRARFVKTVQVLSEIADTYRGMFSFNVEPFVLTPGQPLYGRLTEAGLQVFGWSEEMLAIAPEYVELTGRIACRVEGPNQGMERLGQLRLLKVLAGADDAGGGVARNHEGAVDRASFAKAGAFHLCFIQRCGRVEAALLTDPERETCIDLIREGRRGHPLAEDVAFTTFWTEILSRHAWPVARPIHPDGYVADPRDAIHLYLPRHIVGRALEHPTSRLTVANGITGDVKVLNAQLMGVLRWLSARPRLTSALHRRLIASGRTADGALALMAGLSEGGFIRPLPRRSSSERATARPPQFGVVKVSELCSDKKVT